MSRKTKKTIILSLNSTMIVAFGNFFAQNFPFFLFFDVLSGSFFTLGLNFEKLVWLYAILYKGNMIRDLPQENEFTIPFGY